MLEFYVSYADYQDLIILTEELVSLLAQQVLGKTVIDYQGKEITLTPPWRRWSYHQAILEVNNLNPSILENRDNAIAAAKKLSIVVDPKWPLFNIVNEIFEETVEHHRQVLFDLLNLLQKEPEHHPVRVREPAAERIRQLFLAGLQAAVS